jgi:shikimate kinase
MAIAVSHGAASIIAAFATGKGAALGLGLKTQASVELKNSGGIEAAIKGHAGEDVRLIELCARNTLRHFKLKYGAVVETESDIPIARGLKSSSVAANAVVLAAAGALAERHGEVRNVRLSKSENRQELYIKGRLLDPLELVNVGVESALQARVSVTGAFDDATASFLGGYVVTDNRKRLILRRGDVESMKAVILIPREKHYTIKADLSGIKLVKNCVNAAWNMAYGGEIYTALTLNGLLHSIAFKQDTEPAFKALEAGAVAAGLTGKGPAVVALTRGSTTPIKKAWSNFKCDIIETQTNNQAAYVVTG